MGGQGLGGGIGGDVTVTNTGDLVALAAGSNGVLAQSVGGGGGNGGDAAGFAQIFSKKAAGTKKAQEVTVNIGGSGGAAGDGGDVLVDNAGGIYTAMAESNGIFAQSIGGGGGNGGLVADAGGEIGTFLDQVNKSDAKGGSIAIGGQGAGGGDGGDVDVLNSGLIYTQGSRSNGVFAQSIGGGGGNGGSGLAGEVSVGGFGGTAADGGDVTVQNSGVIITEGFLARGVFAQSIGGGGGNGGATDYDIAQGSDGAPYSYRDDFSDLMEVKGDIDAAIDFAMSLQQPAFGVGVGGAGGAAGNGGEVTVVNTGSIHTSGVLAHGVFAQSVGGGGGTGGEGAIGQVGQVIFSGVGGSAGDGGDVIVTHTGDIVTDGYGAYGIFAQSVGGGGGVAGDVSLGIGSFQLKYGINAFAGDGGNGSDVTVNSTGDIVINGVGGMGIFAQSVGGGGGLYGSAIGLGFIGSFGNDGTAGKVTVTHTGDVVADGKNGIAAVFQSAAKDGVADISATLNGNFRGGSVYGRGVFIDGGRTNVVTINGSASAVSNLAIEGTTGDDTVINNGIVVGDIDLDGRTDGLTAFSLSPFAIGETNAFVNTAKAAFVSLDTVALAGGLLTNQGLIAPGDAGRVQTTMVDGSFLQTAGASFDLDIDFALGAAAQETDRLTMTGAASVAGLFDLRANNVSEIKPGEYRSTLVSAAQGLTNTGAVLDAPTSAVARFALDTTATALDLVYSIDFSPADAGFNQNRNAVGDYVNRVQTAGGSDAFDPVVDLLFGIPDNATLGAVYDSFMPEIQIDNLVAATSASGRFSDAMMACPDGSTRYPTGDNCIWARPIGGRLDLDQTFDTRGFREKTQGLEAGVEARIGGSPFSVGAAISYEDVDSHLEDSARSHGERRQLGLVLRGDFGVFDTAMTLSMGTGEFDVYRGVVTPTGVATAQSRQTFNFTQATAEVSRTFGDSSLYVRPVMEVSVARFEQDAFAETGAVALNLIGTADAEQVVRVRPGLEFGAQFEAGQALVRPYVSAGYNQVIGGDAPGVLAQFAAATMVDPFETTQPLDKRMWEASVGVEIADGSGFSVRAGYQGQFGDKAESHWVGVRVAKVF